MAAREDAYVLLREIGLLRQEQERARGGVSLNAPEQEVVADAAGWALEYRASLPVEDWNAQISLLTGAAAAQMMLKGRVGVLRTMPPADPRDVKRLRRQATALGVGWPEGQTYGEVLSRAGPRRSRAPPPSWSRRCRCSAVPRGHRSRVRPRRCAVTPRSAVPMRT